MESLKKLDNTIEQLERQSRDLEEFARIYKLISSLKSDIELSQAKIVENNNSFSARVIELVFHLRRCVQWISIYHNKTSANSPKKYNWTLKDIWQLNRQPVSWLQA